MLDKESEITLEQAKVFLSNTIYSATGMLEKFEFYGIIRGNGHHLRQKIAELATKLLEERWIGKR